MSDQQTIDSRSNPSLIPQVNKRVSAPILRKQFSRQLSKERFESLPWIQNTVVLEEITKIYEEANSITSLRAFIAIYAGILLWVGCWNLLNLELHDITKKYIWHESYEISGTLYIIIGTLCMFYVGTLYQNAGFSGSWRKEDYYSRHLKLKVSLAYFGQFLYYIGLWSYFDLIYSQTKNIHFKHSLFIIDLILWMLGYIILFVSNTFWGIAGILPPNYQTKNCDINDSKCKHFKFILLSMIVIFAYSLVWSSSSRFLENYGTSSIWRELFYTTCGLLLFIASGNFVANSYIWMDVAIDENNDEINDDLMKDIKQKHDLIGKKVKKSSLGSINEVDFQEQLNYYNPKSEPFLYGPDDINNDNNDKKKKHMSLKKWIIYYCRGFISLESQILHTTGSWNFFDSYFIPVSIWRDIGYVVVGIIGLYWSKALFMKACLTPFNVAGAHPDGIIKALNRPGELLRRQTL